MESSHKSTSGNRGKDWRAFLGAAIFCLLLLGLFVLAVNSPGAAPSLAQGSGPSCPGTARGNIPRGMEGAARPVSCSEIHAALGVSNRESRSRRRLDISELAPALPDRIQP